MIWYRSLVTRQLHLQRFPLVLALVLILAGCQPTAPMSQALGTPTPAPETTTQATPAETSTATTEASSARTGTTAVQGVSLNQEEALPPAALSVLEIDMEVEVFPMQWRVAEVDGKRTTVWVLPGEGAGWHPNSARAGAAGNVVISGHQLLGDAAFAPIALGDLAVNQEILLTDAGGRSFTYRVVDVTEPLPISTDPAKEQILAARYTAQPTEPILTLISGWPDYSSTHRVIVTAELIEAAQ